MLVNILNMYVNNALLDRAYRLIGTNRKEIFSTYLRNIIFVYYNIFDGRCFPFKCIDVPRPLSLQAIK